MSRTLLQISPLLALSLSFVSFKTFSMEQQNLTNTEFQKKSLAIIKAAVQRDGDTMKKILDSTPLAERTFYINFPEYNFGCDMRGPTYVLQHKVNNNYYSLVDVGRRIGIVDGVWRIQTKTNKLLYEHLRFTDSKGNMFEYAIDRPVIQSNHTGGDPIKIKLTQLMIDAYVGNAKNMGQELLKPVDQNQIIYSLFVAIDQGHFDCLQLLLSKKDIITTKDNEKNCGLYYTLLAEAEKQKNIDMFELLIKENPLQCLNRPIRYPAKKTSSLRTVLDLYSSKASPSINENSDFFKQCVEICKQYGAKTLEELVQEGMA